LVFGKHVLNFLSAEAVQSYWAFCAHREKQSAPTVSDENLCKWQMHCKVKVLVLCVSVEENEEDTRRDCWSTRGKRNSD